MRDAKQFNGWRLGGLILLLIAVILVALSFIDVTPGFGMVQMVQLLLGLTAFTGAAFFFIYSSRPAKTPRSLQADIGVRLAATGLVFAYVCGLSDLIGIGTHVQPAFERPAVGWLQLGGLAIGALLVISGLLLYTTSRGARNVSLLAFLIPRQEADTAKDQEPAGR